MTSWVTVVIPTRDSAAWIGDILEHYRRHGIIATILLDSRTRDATAAIARRAGSPVVALEGFSCTEAAVALTRHCVSTPWALFVHDDEIPSDALFARLRGAEPPTQVESVAIPRRWAWYVPGEPLRYGRSQHWPDRTERPGSDHAWRLFRPDRVRFITEMHTDGFIVGAWSRMPADAYLVHFEWVIRSHAQRREKLLGYDRVRYGYGRFFERMYLPESQPEGVIEYLPFDTDRYDALARRYYAARRVPSRPARTGWLDHLARARHRIAACLLGRPREPADRAGLAPRPDQEITGVFQPAACQPDPLGAAAPPLEPAGR